MALTALNIAICIIAIARKKRPGLIGGGAPIGWTVLTPISAQSVITLADAVTVGAPASTTTSTSSPRCCIMKSSLFYLRNYSETVGASFLVSKPGYLRLSRAKRSLPPHDAFRVLGLFLCDRHLRLPSVTRIPPRVGRINWMRHIF